VIGSLATTGFPRLRVGVGRGEGERELAGHVLGRFFEDEREQVSAAVLRAADATEMFLRDGIERVMNAFNAAEKQDPEPEA
jgi:peptidyl-tRNA hydrolase, PTH1 family